LYWAINKKFTAGVDVFYDSVYSGPDNAGVHLISEATTIRTALSATALNPFGLTGLSARLAASYVDQDITYVDFSNQPVPQSDTFWIADASISYLLPQRRGFLTLTVRNLFDKQFRYQELDPANPILAPGRLVFARINLSF
jgi:outer membrane receptor protein involved in Fe transport